MVNSFIITPRYFTNPEVPGKRVRESGIEDRYKRAFEKTDNHFIIYKDDWSDGVIRYTVDNEIKFYGIQECKVDNTRSSFYARLTQGLAYIAQWVNQYPKIKEKFKVLILPTEKKIDIVYVENLLNSSFWSEFTFYYSEHRQKNIGNSASNFYEKSLDIQSLIWQYHERFKVSHRIIGRSLDLKEVTEEILQNCL